MADVKIIDIDSEQWNIKDQEARNQIAILEEKVTKNFTYSTDEVDTGKKWIDGKKIYRKTTIFSNFTFNVGDTNVPHGVSNLGQLTHFEIFNNQNGLGNYFRVAGTTATTITLYNTVPYALASQNGFFTIEYTKTTG